MKISIYVEFMVKKGVYGWVSFMKASSEESKWTHRKFVYRVIDGNGTPQRAELIAYINALQCVKPSMRSGNEIHLYCSQYARTMISKNIDGMWTYNAKTNEDLVQKLRDMVNKYSTIHLEEMKSCKQETVKLRPYLARKISFRQWQLGKLEQVDSTGSVPSVSDPIDISDLTDGFNA